MEEQSGGDINISEKIESNDLLPVVSAAMSETITSKLLSKYLLITYLVSSSLFMRT